MLVSSVGYVLGSLSVGVISGQCSVTVPLRRLLPHYLGSNLKLVR